MGGNKYHRKYFRLFMILVTSIFSSYSLCGKLLCMKPDALLLYKMLQKIIKVLRDEEMKRVKVMVQGPFDGQ